MTDTNPQRIALDAGLYLVPTPIGNLRDITLRALDVLKHCDYVLCEDTRMTGKLLKAYQIDKKKIVYNDHSADFERANILNLLSQGKVLALVSDAGTPLISDPGYKLVRDCASNGYAIIALPGANAVLPALQLSALPTDKFLFAGFLPSKDKSLRDLLERYAQYPETLIFYETAPRLQDSLKAISEIFGEARQVAVVREISKMFEESIRGEVADVIEQCAQKTIKGEIVIVIEGYDASLAIHNIDDMIVAALKKGESIKDLSSDIAALTGGKKKDIYDRAVTLRQRDGQ